MTIELLIPFNNIPFDKNDLFRACMTNDNIKLYTLLNRGIDIDSTTDLGNTALYIACKQGNTILVSYLINNNANINHQNNKGMTALHIASLYGFIDIVALLLKNKANTNIECNKGLIPLSYCLMSRTENHNLITNLLLNK
jgi:ankyrin repeat protein